LHIGRGLYYGSYLSPRVLVWSIGVIILVLMMAIFNIWPNCEIDFFNININPILSNILPMNKSRTKAILRIGPHNKETLDVIICGMLGDFWADTIKGKIYNSTRFQIEQSLSNSSYIHFLTLYFYNLGYCARPIPSLIEKKDTSNVSTISAISGWKVSRSIANPILDSSDRSFAKTRAFASGPLSVLGEKVDFSKPENRFNYRLTLFTFTSFNWIYDSFYTIENGIAKKKVPFFISDYITPVGLANWIMQDGSFQKGQGIFIATNSFTFEECKMLALILSNKYGFRTSVIKTGHFDQWRISIWKESMPLLAKIVGPYIIPEMEYKLKGYL
jgi:ubiquinol-cytochrome c reductase cytochrome b subunit